MNAKIKATELIEKFYPYSDRSGMTDKLARANAKECAIIHVEGILEATKKRKFKFLPNTIKSVWVYDKDWQQVKNELSK